MMIGLKDVARAAGVSVSTVSRVITGSPLVNAETRANVQHAMDSLQYRPSRVARRLRRDSARANLIGLIVPDIQNPFSQRTAFARLGIFTVSTLRLFLQPQRQLLQRATQYDARAARFRKRPTAASIVRLASRGRCVETARRATDR